MEENGVQTRVSIGALTFTALVGAFLAAFLIYPVLYVFKEAFWIEGRFSAVYFRIMLFENDVLRESIVNSLKLALCTTAATTLLSVPLALLGARFRFRGKALLSGLLLVPLIMPPFVGAVGIKQILARGGSLNILLVRELGLFKDEIDFLGQGGFWAIMVLQVLHLYPIMYLNVTAALANIDPTLEEAARNMGDSGFRLFRKVTFPLMLPGYFAGAVLVFIWSFTDLGTPLIFDFRRVVAAQIFFNLQDVNVNRMAYALVVVLIGLSSLAFLAGKLYVGRRGYAMIAKGGAARVEKPLSGPLTALTWCALLALLFVALLPHLTVLLTALAGKWSDTILPARLTLRYFHTAATHDLAVRSVKNSLLLSAGSTALDVVMGVGIAYILVRKRFAGAALLDALAMLPLALPGIVIAFGFATCFSGTILDARANPFPLLMIAYAIRRLPFMVRASVAGFQQTSPTLEEAAMNVGASPLRALWSISIPLIMANLIAGAVLSFSFAMLEVSDSLVLAFSRNHYPITKAIYTLAGKIGDGPFIACAMGMLAMILLSGTLVTASLLLGKRMGQLFRL